MKYLRVTVYYRNVVFPSVNIARPKYNGELNVIIQKIITNTISVVFGLTHFQSFVIHLINELSKGNSLSTMENANSHRLVISKEN